MNIRRGIALLEVLVAISILVMMMAAVWVTFDSAVKGSEIATKIQDRYSGIRVALNRIASEIPHAYLSFNRPPDETKHYTMFEGRTENGNSALTFSSFSHLRMRKDADESDQAVVSFFLAQDPNDSTRTHLFRRESARLEGDLPEQLGRFAPAYILCEDVSLLELAYWEPFKKEWIREWSTIRNDAQPDRLPERVKITIGFRNDEGDVEKFTTQTIIYLEEKIDASRGQ